MKRSGIVVVAGAAAAAACQLLLPEASTTDRAASDAALTDAALTDAALSDGGLTDAPLADAAPADVVEVIDAGECLHLFSDFANSYQPDQKTWSSATSTGIAWQPGALMLTDGGTLTAGRQILWENVRVLRIMATVLVPGSPQPTSLLTLSLVPASGPTPGAALIKVGGTTDFAIGITPDGGDAISLQFSDGGFPEGDGLRALLQIGRDDAGSAYLLGATIASNDSGVQLSTDATAGLAGLHGPVTVVAQVAAAPLGADGGPTRVAVGNIFLDICPPP